MDSMTPTERLLRDALTDELLSSIEQSALEASHYDRASYNLGWRGRDDTWFFKVWREKLIAAVAPLLTPRAWQPMEEFAKRRESFHATFNGGHKNYPELRAFHHGMDTVFNCIEAELRGERRQA